MPKKCKNPLMMVTATTDTKTDKTTAEYQTICPVCDVNGATKSLALQNGTGETADKHLDKIFTRIGHDFIIKTMEVTKWHLRKT